MILLNSVIPKKWLLQTARFGAREFTKISTIVIVILLVTAICQRSSRRAEIKTEVLSKLQVRETEERYDFRAITLPLSNEDVDNPLIREDQAIDLLLINKALPSDDRGAVMLFIEDLRILAVSRGAPPPANAMTVIDGNQPPPGPAGYVTVRATSLESMLIAFANQADRFRIIPRVSGAKSHLNFYNTLNVSNQNFNQMAIHNLASRPAAATRTAEIRK